MKWYSTIVSRPVARYAPSRRYFSLALAAIAGALLSAWSGLHWSPGWAATAGFGVTAAGLLLLALRPAIEIHKTHLLVGRRVIPWRAIRRLDRTGWNAPLAVRLTLEDNRRLAILYPGDLDSCTSLLRHLRRSACWALLDGIPYRQFWGEPLPPERKQLAPPRYPVLRQEDEDEVERLYQQLKSVGRLDTGTYQRESEPK